MSSTRSFVVAVVVALSAFGMAYAPGDVLAAKSDPILKLGKSAAARFTIAQPGSHTTSIFVSASLHSDGGTGIYHNGPAEPVIGVFQETCDLTTNEVVLRSFRSLAGQTSGLAGFKDDLSFAEVLIDARHILEPPNPAVRVRGEELRISNCESPNWMSQTTVPLGLFSVPLISVQWNTIDQPGVGGGLDPTIGALGCMEVASQLVVYRGSVAPYGEAHGVIDLSGLPLSVPLGSVSLDSPSSGSIAQQADAYAFTTDPLVRAMTATASARVVRPHPSRRMDPDSLNNTDRAQASHAVMQQKEAA